MKFRTIIVLVVTFIKIQAQSNCASFSTYFGGIQYDEIKSVCVDQNKNSYILGNTYSVDLPITVGLLNDTASGNYDAFLAKFNSCGQLVWCTYFGTTNFDSGEKIKLCNDGNLIFCGYSSGTNLPTNINSFQNINNGGYDCYLTKITPYGTLIWCTYFGKGNGDFAYDVSVDALDNIIMGGTTTSANLYTTPSSFQPNHKGNTDAFIARFNKNGILNWCTYYGGNGNEDIHALAVDSNYNIIGTGGTFSSNLNTSVNAFQSFIDGTPDVYLIKLDSIGSRVFSTYYGGMLIEDAWGIATDGIGNIYLSGQTKSNDFDTTANAYQTLLKNNSNDWFLSKWSSNGTLLYSTLFGGQDEDLMSRMIFQTPDKLTLFGKTNSNDIPIVGSNNPQTSIAGDYDYFIAQFNTNTMQPIWTSYYGGTQSEESIDLAGVGYNEFWFVGTSNSTNFPLSTTPYQSALNNSSDGTITKLRVESQTTQIKNTNKEFGVAISPNPFNNQIKINFTNKNIVEVIIQDVYGKNIYSGKELFIDTQNLLSGIYFITIKTNNSCFTQKIIKE